MKIPDASFERQLTVNMKPDSRQSTVNDSVVPFLNPSWPNQHEVLDGAPSIPGYRITERIAQGGMGRIYAAIDESLDREVAIKTLLPGADAERFLTEARITARLPHPGIPPVHAQGTLPDGTPWLAMKLIRGQTLAHLLTKRLLQADNTSDLARYIQIFEQIAQAVGFAHSRGIIHRDLKPLNVMIGEFGEVQVMDWGLAKDLFSSGQPGASPTPEAMEAAHTVMGTVMGTPGYMAPEQARGEILDARADVFALGAILAAILTGQPAFVGLTIDETIDKAASADLTDVRDRLAACGADSELVALALRCLSANPAERYADGSEVATAVAAYRARVEARMRQAETAAAAALVREAEQRKRRRLTLAAAASIATVLLLGLAISLWQMNRAILAEAQAKANEKEAREHAEREQLAKLEAERQRLQAERNLTYAKKGNQILGSVFTGLAPKKIAESGRPLHDVLRENLVLAVKELDGSAIGDPVEVAEMQNNLGSSLLALGEAKLAIEVYQKSYDTLRTTLGSDHTSTLICMNNLASSYQAAEQLDKALPLYEQALAIRKEKFGPNHSDTLTSVNNLAGCYRARGQLSKALPLLEETLERRRATQGPDYQDTLVCLNNLATLYYEIRQYEQALSLFKEALQLRKAKLGHDHPETLVSMNNLAMAHRAMKQFDQALDLLQDAYRLQKVALGPDHPETLASLSNLGLTYLESGQQDEAIPLLEDALRLRKFKLGPDHSDTLLSKNLLGMAYCRAGRANEAVPLLQAYINGRRTRLADQDLRFAALLAQTAHELLLGAQHQPAAEMLRECLAIREKKEPDAWTTFNTMSMLGGALLGQKQYAEAETLLLQGYEGLKNREQTIPPQANKRVCEAIDRLIALYEAWEKPDEAARWRQERTRHQEAQADVKKP